MPFCNFLFILFKYILENLFGYGEFLPSSAFMDALADIVCDKNSLPQLCENIVFLLVGFDSGQANLTLMDTIVHHTPAGASSKTIVHYAQEMASGNIIINLRKKSVWVI